MSKIQQNGSVMGFTNELFGKILDHAVMNSFFIFSGKFYKQVEGLGMGLPLGPTFANIISFSRKANITASIRRWNSVLIIFFSQ